MCVVSKVAVFAAVALVLSAAVRADVVHQFQFTDAAAAARSLAAPAQRARFEPQFDLPDLPIGLEPQPRAQSPLTPAVFAPDLRGDALPAEIVPLVMGLLAEAEAPASSPSTDGATGQ